MRCQLSWLWLQKGHQGQAQHNNTQIMIKFQNQFCSQYYQVSFTYKITDQLQILINLELAIHICV
jgi:hypothetical protein